MPLTSALNLHLFDTHETNIVVPMEASPELRAYCESLSPYRKDARFIVYAYAVATVFRTKCGMYETVVDSPKRNKVQGKTRRLLELSEKQVWELRAKDDYIGIFKLLESLDEWR